MRTVETLDQVRELARGSIGLVPTMGFLHEGHFSLIDAAREANESVVVSLFINPLQFSDSSDLASYPRDIRRDAAAARDAGADLLYVPHVDTMYPNGSRSTVTVAGVSEGMEGANRPGHFEGVATVVAKLFAGIKPDRAYFGRKDAQQLAVVRAMAMDLSFPVEVVGLPIVREPDGLALSSRNVRIAREQRTLALNLSRAVFAAADAFDAGERSATVLRGTARATVDEDPGIEVEYVEVADVLDASAVDRINGPAFIAIAARIGGVRLIDNVLLDPAAERADRGTNIDHPSILYGGH
jgi:pantoate--beta-alanine ligase